MSWIASLYTAKASMPRFPSCSALPLAARGPIREAQAWASPMPSRSTAPSRAAATRLQMAIADRTLDPPGDFGSEHTDAMSARDQGWLMGWAATPQEVFDNTLINFRVGEDPQGHAAPVCLPGRLFSFPHPRQGRPARLGAGEGIPSPLQGAPPVEPHLPGLPRTADQA